MKWTFYEHFIGSTPVSTQGVQEQAIVVFKYANNKQPSRVSWADLVIIAYYA